MAVAVFDYSLWSLRFPTLVPKVPSQLAAMYFIEACQLLDNTDCSLVTDVNERLMLLNLLVAHLAALNGATPQGEAGLVGRISGVTEGSVNLNTEYPTNSAGLEKWYSQTPYGAQYWAMTVQYRRMTYVAGQQPFLGVTGPIGFYPSR